MQVDVPASHGVWTVLAFYPADFTFICPTELRAFADLHDDFRARRRPPDRRERRRLLDPPHVV